MKRFGFVFFLLLPFSGSAEVFKLSAELSRQSGITFRLPYSLGTHQGWARQLEGELQVTSGVVQGRLQVPIAALHTGNVKMDCHLREALGLDYTQSRYPKEHICDTRSQIVLPDNQELPFSKIEFLLAEGQKLPGKEGETVWLGTWKIHGVERPAEMKLDFARQGDLIKIRGKVAFSLKDFGIVVKPFLFIKVADQAEVDLDLNFAPVVKPQG